MGRLGLKDLLGYLGLLAVAAVAFALVRQQGELLSAPPGPAIAVATATGAPDVLLHVLLALLTIVLAARALGALVERIGQPPVIGEVVAGIALGPSLLGRLSPELANFVLPEAVAPSLMVIAQLGVVLSMFLVGVHLDTAALRGKKRASVAISHASIVTPFILGSTLALWLYPRVSSPQVPFTVFALFMGVAMSVTAFPVLARILKDRHLDRTELGVIALACAAVDDVTAWCLLAFVVSVVKAEPNQALVTVVLTAAYIAAMFTLGRPVVRRLVAWQEARPGLSATALSLTITGLLGSALITQAIGVHALFGAFLFGAIIPHDSSIARELDTRLEALVRVLLLPAFFAVTGLRTRIDLVSGAEQWLACALIIVVATAGKFGGTFVAARLTGLKTLEAAALGALMNTRGLMQLIVLEVGRELGVLSPTLFAMMVVMALVTTVATAPVVHALTRGEAPAPAPAEPAAG